jgi:diguanylate cyclase (GGDEF)-like protein
MISIKKHMDDKLAVALDHSPADDPDLLPLLLTAYGTAVLAMATSTFEACPSADDDLKQRLRDLSTQLSIDMRPEVLAAIDREIEERLQEWGQRAARYYRERAAEVKDLLLTMAKTAEAVGARDQRYAAQIGLVTAQLRQIATLDDVAEIRASVEKGAAAIKNSIERMTAEGHAAVAELREQVKIYRVKLEDATEQASRDSLTGVRNRASVERLAAERMAVGAQFCVAMLDLDDFKQVNDTHGHVVGDQLLKMFATELRSSCRSTDVVGRWGGDEFILLLDCGLVDARARVERLRKWVCGSYTVRCQDRLLKLRLEASIGLAAHRENESLQDLVARADAAMYEFKSGARISADADVGQPR